ncbi:uncharacterized protein LOC135155393 [Lytechinus pictus]|uniref:uncharacterized protein LOC135155393 n=1 Tax=Lytechinus pictus TaxID=7653 RepID=UPI0030B9DFEC
MARIDVDNHFTDAEGNNYNIHMTDHTQGPFQEVLDGICNFIINTAIGGPGIIWTGWVEMIPGNFVYWVDPGSPLCVFLDAEALVQHPDNFLCFRRNGNGITITHFGPFGWNKGWDLKKVKAARKHAKDLAKEAEKEQQRMEEEREIWDKEDPPLSEKTPSKRQQRLPGLNLTKSEALEEMQAKVLKKVGGLVARKTLVRAAIVAGKQAVKAIAKASAKAAPKSVLKKVPLIGLVAGVGFGVSRAVHGDFAGAGMAVASGAVSLVPGVGTVASLAIDGALLVRDVGDDIKKEAQEEEAKQKALYDKELQEWTADKDKMIRLIEHRIEELRNAQDGCNHCVEGCDHLIELYKKAGAGDEAKE